MCRDIAARVARQGSLCLPPAVLHDLQTYTRHTYTHTSTNTHHTHTTDSFSGTFRPCSLDKPKVLLPLLNVPMLDYVMEFLVANGVQEVFIFCVNKKEMVEEYMQNSKWSSSVALRCISSAKCMGAGTFV